jgi:hypothetical protein
MANDSKLISIREYARRRECSDTAVRKAIAAGHIKQSALETDKRGRVTGINADLADKQWSKTFSLSGTRNPKLAKKIASKAGTKETILAAEAIDTEADKGLARNASTAKAQQVEAFYKAKLRKLEFEKKSGEVVDKAQVYRALFAAGQEIRTAFEGISDRCIDDILAAPTRNDAHTILQNAIDDVLKTVSELKDRQITRHV